GDAAHVPWGAHLVPGVAPAAKQMGRHAARAVRARLSGGRVRPFRYRHYGNLATLGRSRAVIDFGWVRLRGWPAWWVWGIAHIYFLISMRTRLLVALQWLWSYVTSQRGARLITAPRGWRRRRHSRGCGISADPARMPGPGERSLPGRSLV